MSIIQLMIYLAIGGIAKWHITKMYNEQNELNENYLVVLVAYPIIYPIEIIKYLKRKKKSR